MSDFNDLMKKLGFNAPKAGEPQQEIPDIQIPDISQELKMAEKAKHVKTVVREYCRICGDERCHVDRVVEVHHEPA